MRSIRELWGAFAERGRWLLLRRRVERELDEELRAHLDEQVDRHLDRGMTPASARREARLRLGGVEQIKERVRDASGVRPLHDLMTDLRFAGRLLRRRTVFATAVVLTLGLGIGATTALFTVVNAVQLRSLPYPQAERLLDLWGTVDGVPTPFGNASLPDLQSWQERSDTLDAFAGYTDDRVELGGAAEPDLVTIGRVTDAFFVTLGVRAVAGRLPGPGEFVADSGLALLSHGSWQRRFEGSSDAVGATVRLGEETYRIIGVVEPLGLALPRPDTELWVPHAVSTSRGSRSLRAIARLVDGHSLAEAQAEMEAISQQLATQYPESNAERAVRLAPLKQRLVGDTRRPMALFAAAALLVFAVACVNTINLFHVGSLERRVELGVRAALGARRKRLVQSVLVEALLLASIGGLLGVGLAWAGVREFTRRVGGDFPRLAEVAVDPVALAFALFVSLAAAMLVGVAPALSVARQAQLIPSAADASASRSGSGLGRRPLLVVQIATTFVLVFGAGLLLRTTLLLERTDPGLDPGATISFRVTLPASRYGALAEVMSFHARLRERLASLPGVESVGAINVLPFARGSLGNAFGVDGAAPGPDAPSAQFRVVDGDYFGTVGMRIVRGRGLEPGDWTPGEPVALINESLAELAWPGRDPVGRAITIFDTEWQVAGVVGDVRDGGLDRPPSPTVFAPFPMRPRRYMTYTVRHDANVPVTIRTVRDVVWTVDPELPLQDPGRLEGLVDASIREHRNRLLLLGAMGALALVLSAIGVYGVTAHTVNGRRREVAIRLALGAPPARILGWATWRGLSPVLGGVGVGVAASLSLARAFGTFVHGFAPTDPMMLGVPLLTMVAVGLVAALLPSRRASRVDPATSLR